jgi:hypothetical protein
MPGPKNVFSYQFLDPSSDNLWCQPQLFGPAVPAKNEFAGLQLDHLSAYPAINWLMRGFQESLEKDLAHGTVLHDPGVEQFAPNFYIASVHELPLRTWIRPSVNKK